MKFKRKQKDVLTELAEEKERLKIIQVEAFRAKKLVMNRLGKTVELIVKLENNLYDEGKDDQKVKIRDQLETRGLEAARDHEMLELEGTPQDIVDFRRKFVPALIFHACPNCGDDKQETKIGLQNGYSFVGNVKKVLSLN
jgi:activator of HSP90 ATPase